MESDFAQAVYSALKKVPQGRVTSYSALAKAIGRPGAARAIGNALNKNPFAPQVPCHRVVKSNGEVGGFAHGTKKKIKLLKSEGIKIKNNKIIDFNLVLYKF
ncbi:MGMT family protein [bacterium]|nr:MGMT family protein [bacterium]